MSFRPDEPAAIDGARGGARGGTVRQRAEATVRIRAGVITIDSPATFARPRPGWVPFVDALCGLPEIRTIAVDRVRGRAELRFDAALASPALLLERVAGELRTHASSLVAAPLAERLGKLGERALIELFRRGSRFSTWEIVHELPGRIRVRDKGLRGNAAALRRLELELATLAGVQTASAGTTTGSILVRFAVEALDRDRLLAALDELLCEPGTALSTLAASPKQGFTLANTALAVAAVGELAFPAVLPVSALLLLFANLSNFRKAFRDLRSRHLGLPALHTAIVAATLASSGFVASSLMNWLLVYWEKRHKRRIATAQQILGASVRKQNRTAWLCRDGVQLETPARCLQAGDVIFVREGDVLPIDGRVVSGRALVDESLLRSASGPIERRIGESLLRGTQLLEGELHIEVTRCGEQTVAARVGQAIDAATRNTSLSFKRNVPTMADRAVRPALLTAGVGLLVGDAATAAAILRPDYATGPELGLTLLLVQQLGASLKAGLVVRQARVFAEMAEIDLLLIDDPAEFQGDDARSGPGDAALKASIERLRVATGLQVGLVTSAGRGETRAAELGADFCCECDSDQDRQEWIVELQQDGHRVAYAGPCRLFPLATSAADVAIAPMCEQSGDDDLADVWLLGDDLGRIAWLCEVSRASRRQSQMHQGLLLVPNLTCVAGAFLFGFTSLVPVVVSNLGTYTVYRRSVMALRETELQLLSRQSLKAPTPNPSADQSEGPIAPPAVPAEDAAATDAVPAAPYSPMPLETTLIA